MNEPENDATPRASKTDEDPWVMYLVVHNTLGMSPGKLGAQIGHAVMLACMHYSELLAWRREWVMDLNPESHSVKTELLDRWQTWTSAAFRKVVLQADDKEWEKVKAEVKPYFLVRDAGLTQVSAGSETCLSIWPMRKSERPRILKRLQALP
jgi:PTH2 family peptidyl-tRNA hydrolase